MVEARNIKSRETRNGVSESLTALLGHLRALRALPPHGLAIFVGNGISVVVEPPDPLGTYLYRCGSGFVLDAVEAMQEEPETYGLIVVDRAEATVGILSGSSIKSLFHLDSHLPSKHDAGGQSQRRFERTMENETEAYLRRLAERANGSLLPLYLSDHLQGILLGGPGSTKDVFAQTSSVDYRLAQKILKPFFSIGYTDESGLKELARTAAETLEHLCISTEQAILRAFLDRVHRASLVTYGKREVIDALQAGRVERLLLSREIPDAVEVAEIARTTRSEVSLIGTGTDEGSMFLKGFSGYGAFLRY